ncbi:alginate lyase family protein [Solimicrobium silvestre]|uniref:Alginate lyase n=1 Tax=Solimicrobium silvestre TaxID=2099400 RepID=A0A2S9GWJ2_9BURK|nr:alginate lyase family protein [Solimicrobium silvestre]PRC92084.1 Alginate lyase [Solimicrobium silvestre]
MRKTLIVIALSFITAQAAIAAQATPWCTVDSVPDTTIKSLQKDADKRSADQSRAIARVHTEGTLPHQGIWDQSIEAKKDLPLIRELALIWRVNHDPAVLTHLTTLLDAWASIYQPSFNPIDETDFDAIIDAYAITEVDLPATTRDKVAALLHRWATGYIDQMLHNDKPGKGKWTNNWQSHRIKLATLSAVALGDTRLIDAARWQFLKQINQNLHSNGLSIDFEERDALHYTVYDLEPLVRAAMAARTIGQDWLNLQAENGASLAAGLNWLLPYARGEQTHEEYVHTTVKFDLQRRDAGVAGFTGMWEPKSSGQLYWLASTLDAHYLPVAQSLINQSAWIAACWQAR